MVDILMGLFSLPPSMLIALAAVMLVGLPHGALDGAIALHLGLFKKKGSLVRFICVYLAGALMVLVTWLTAPVFALSVFLLVSLFHFGAGDARTGRPPERKCPASSCPFC